MGNLKLVSINKGGTLENGLAINMINWENDGSKEIKSTLDGLFAPKLTLFFQP